MAASGHAGCHLSLEQAQARFESYHFEIRKNLIEYDEAVNRQRQIVYDERRSILEGDGSDLPDRPHPRRLAPRHS